MVEPREYWALVTMATGCLIGGVFFGFIVGWCWRSWQFFHDHECANPIHNDPSRSKLNQLMSCETCKHCRPRTPKDKIHEAGHKQDRHWCVKLSFPTRPELMRCGGDDYEIKPLVEPHAL